MAIDLNELNFAEETNEGLVLLDFYADWCGPCRALAPMLEQLENVKVVKVNIDDNQELAQKYQVSAIPKLVFLKDGKEMDAMTGVSSKASVQKKIDDILEG